MVTQAGYMAQARSLVQALDVAQPVGARYRGFAGEHQAAGVRRGHPDHAVSCGEKGYKI